MMLKKIKKTVRKKDPFYQDFEQWKNEFEQLRFEKISTQLLSETTLEKNHEGGDAIKG